MVKQPVLFTHRAVIVVKVFSLKSAKVSIAVTAKCLELSLCICPLSYFLDMERERWSGPVVMKHSLLSVLTIPIAIL